MAKWTPEGNRLCASWRLALVTSSVAAVLVQAGLCSPWLAQGLSRLGLVVAAAVMAAGALGRLRLTGSSGRPVTPGGGAAQATATGGLSSEGTWTPLRAGGSAIALLLALWGATAGFLLPGQVVMPVLTYHRVTQPPKRRYPVPVTTPSDFAWELKWLSVHGYHTVDPERLGAPRKGWRGKPLVITFDDGWRDNLAAARQLHRRGLTGVVFVVSGDLGRPMTLRPQDLATLERLGVRIGSHTVTHPHLDQLDAAGRRRELVASRQALERLLGHRIDLFASPYGSADLTPELASLARESGYRYAFASHNFGLNLASPSPYRVRRLLVPSNPWLARLEFLVFLW